MTDDRMLQDHKSTYSGFIKVSIAAATFAATVLILMAIFLV